MKKNVYSVHEWIPVINRSKYELVFQLEQTQSNDWTISEAVITLRWGPPGGTMVNDCFYNP